MAIMFKEWVRRAQRAQPSLAQCVLVGIALDMCKGKQVLLLPSTHLLWAAATSNLCTSFWQFSSRLREKAADTLSPIS